MNRIDAKGNSVINPTLILKINSIKFCNKFYLQNLKCTLLKVLCNVGGLEEIFMIFLKVFNSLNWNCLF